MDRRPITVSKYLAKYLRHAPAELGVTLQPGGSFGKPRCADVRTAE
jgi:hypothetical protein